MPRTCSIKGKRPKAFVGALVGLAGNLIQGAMNQQSMNAQLAGQEQIARINADAAAKTAQANADMQTANQNFQLSTMQENNLVNSIAQYNNMAANDVASLNALARGNRIAYKCGGTVKRSARKKLANGFATLPLRGSYPDVQVENGGHIETAGVASDGTPVYEFKGRSHRNGGINVTVNGTPINVEGNEYIAQTSNGESLVIPQRKLQGIDFRKAIKRGMTPDNAAILLAQLHANNPQYDTEYTNDNRQKGAYGLGWDSSNWWNLGGNAFNSLLALHNYKSNKAKINETYNAINSIYDNYKPALIDTSALISEQSKSFAPAFAALQTPRVSIGSRLGQLSRAHDQARRDIISGTNSFAARLDRFGDLETSYFDKAGGVYENADNQVGQMTHQNAQLATQTNVTNAQQRNAYVNQLSDMLLKTNLANQAATNDANRFVAEGRINNTNWLYNARANNNNYLFSSLQNGVTDTLNYWNDNRRAKRQDLVSLAGALGNMDVNKLEALGLTRDDRYGVFDQLLNTFGFKPNRRNSIRNTSGRDPLLWYKITGEFPK